MFKVFKHIVCIVLVAVFLLQTFTKTIILTNYTINKGYISKVLCVNKNKPKMHCNGKCHLKKELNKAEKEERSPANSTNEESDIQLFSEPSISFDLFSSVALIKNELLPDYTFHLSDKHLDSVFRPPLV